MIVLDTTVLVYATGEEHPLRAPCRAVVRAVGEGTVRATTTAEVLQEFAHVRARRQGRAEAAARAAQFCDLLAPLLPLDEGALRRGVELFGATTAIGAFDAVLAAAVLRVRSGDATLVSADRGFAMVPGLSWVDPSDAAALRRVGVVVDG